MKIAVDGYELRARPTGVGRVLHNIVINLAALRPGLELIVFGGKDTGPLTPGNIEHRLLPVDRGYTRWQNGPLYRKLKALNPDLLLAPNYTLPVFGSWKSLLIVHDVSFVSRPEGYTRLDVLKRRFLTKRSLRKAGAVVTVSEFSKREILRSFPVDPAKINVVYHGVEDRFQAVSGRDLEEWKRKKGIHGKRIIGYLGSIFNRRHIPLLVEAVERMRRERPETLLYVVGKDLTRPAQDIPGLLAGDGILWEKELDDGELPLFYSSLSAFAYLSEYEGFGLPPLEALACGTVPVLLAKTSLAEVYSDLAVMIGEVRAEPVRAALETACTDEGLRKEILGRFLDRRADFSWRRAAKDFSDLIDRICRTDATGREP